MSAELEEIRRHVLRFGWNSTCFQVVHPELRHWWSADREGLVGYVVSGRLAVVAGAPICPEDRLDPVIAEWTAFCEAHRWTPCYFGAEERLHQALAGCPGYCEIVLGAQPDWSPAEFIDRFRSTPSLRAQANRARHKGVLVHEASIAEAERDPELRAVLRSWVQNRGLPTMRFLVEPFTLDYLPGRRVFVAERNGVCVAFLVLCPAPGRNGWLTEEFPRTPEAPNGTVELLMLEACRRLDREGADYLTMGIVPLFTGGLLGADPAWLRPLRSWAQAHYNRFYNFRGLFEFKNKFRPARWTPVRIIVRADQFRFAHLRGLAQAFTRMPPELAIAIGCYRAARTELIGLANALRQTVEPISSRFRIQ